METATYPAAECMWAWRFGSVESLVEDGLEQYTGLAADTIVSHYGEQTGGEVDGESHLAAVRKRTEIDRCMEDLKCPYRRRILDLYYRHGKSCEHWGWVEVAREMKIAVNPKRMLRSEQIWDRELERAVWSLWRVHRKRWREEA